MSEKKPKKRKLRKKKLPFFEFKTLKITGQHTNGGKGTGTGTSKRFHLRRAHIRHIGENRRPIFVKACAVGDKTKGTIMKDYTL